MLIASGLLDTTYIKLWYIKMLFGIKGRIDCSIVYLICCLYPKCSVCVDLSVYYHHSQFIHLSLQRLFVVDVDSDESVDALLANADSSCCFRLAFLLDTKITPASKPIRAMSAQTRIDKLVSLADDDDDDDEFCDTSIEWMNDKRGDDEPANNDIADELRDESSFVSSFVAEIRAKESTLWSTRTLSIIYKTAFTDSPLATIFATLLSNCKLLNPSTNLSAEI